MADSPPWEIPPWEEAAKRGAANASMLEDVAKSAGIGVVQGALGIPGLPGTVADFGDALALGAYRQTLGRVVNRVRNGTWDAPPAEYYQKAEADASAAARAKGFPVFRPTEFLPSGADLQRGVEQVTGPFYQPKTTPGQYAKTIGEFTPGAFLSPGSIMERAFGYVAAPAVASEFAGQQLAGTAYEPFARLAAGLGAGVLAGAALRPGGVARGAADVPQLPVAAEADQMRVPLTRGQRTGALPELRAEDQAFRGQLGQGAQEVAGAFVPRQREALDAARGTIQTTIAGGRPVVPDTMGAAQVVGEAVRRGEQQFGQYVDDQYKLASEMGGAFSPQAFQGIGKRIKQDIQADPNAIPVDRVTTPLAAKALDDIDATISKLKPVDITDPRKKMVPVTLDEMDASRKRLNAYYRAAAPGSPDEAALGNVIRTFDKHIDDAVTRGLFIGDDAALMQLKAARDTAREYFARFTKQGPGDDVGNFIQNLVNVKRDLQPTEIANALYGAARLGQTGLAVRAADRIKTIVGENSDAWAALRQGAWIRAAGDETMGALRRAQSINDFTTGPGRQLAQRLFSPQEIDQMNAYGRVLRATAKQDGATNWSGTAGALGPSIARMGVNSTATTVGSAVGSLLGMPTAGALTGLAIGEGVNAVGRAMNTRRAEHMFAGRPAPGILDKAGDAFVGAFPGTGGAMPQVPSAPQFSLPAIGPVQMPGGIPYFGPVVRPGSTDEPRRNP